MLKTQLPASRPSLSELSADALLRLWFEEVWNQGNDSLIEEIFPEHCVAHGLVDAQGNPARGPKGFREFYSAFRTAFPDVHIEILQTITEGDRTSVHCRVKGTHQKTFQGIPATHRPVVIEGICTARCHQGQIVEAWNHFDFLGLYLQLGVVSLPA